MKTINDINFKGKRALIRVDFNVPLDSDFNVTDDNRIRSTIPTIKKILSDGGSCILMSHLGRPKEGPTEKYSLKHTIATAEKLFGTKIKFADDCIGESAIALGSALKPGEILLLENLRFYKEEEKGDEAFAKKHNNSITEVAGILAKAKTLLFEARSKRVKPGLDDKILCS